MTNITIQIISDTICPWCYIGLRRLSHAITTHQSSHPSDTFTLTWHTYYLHPSKPDPDSNSHSKAQVETSKTSAAVSRLIAAGDAEGILVHSSQARSSTRDSHRLLWYAGVKQKGKKDVGGLQTRVAERLFRVFFEEGRDLSDLGVLVEVAVAEGLDRYEVEMFLASGDGGNEVDREAERARRRSIIGVPYFTVQGRYGIEGAGELEMFLGVFEKVRRP